MRIAIHPDDYTHNDWPPGSDASAPRWAAAILRAGHEVRWVDVRRSDILEQLKGCQGFMWRFEYTGTMKQIARRLLPVLENELGITCYPNQDTCWHYDDKIAQAYLFSVLGIPTARTWVWYDRQAALDWLLQADFPLVIKLAGGAGSANVKLVETAKDARQWLNMLFTYGLFRLELPSWARPKPWPFGTRLRAAAKGLLRGFPLGPIGCPIEDRGESLEKGYVLFQEYLVGNSYDTRITVIGNRAFGFRRFNRPNDFRASGSGYLDHGPAEIQLSAVRLAFRCARKLKGQSVACDILQRSDGTDVVVEVSYTYVSWAVERCPGHWELEGDPENGSLTWVEGHMWPEEAQIADYLECLERSGRA